MNEKKTGTGLKRIAIYPISANPPTWGHGDILKRAANHFDHVYWAAAVNTQKKYLFSPEERVQMMEEYVKHYQLENITVEAYKGSTVRYAEKREAQVIIKGLRNITDFHGELEQSMGNQGINKSIETFYIFAHPHLSALSSSLVRELALLGEDIGSYVPNSVAGMVVEILSRQSTC